MRSQAARESTVLALVALLVTLPVIPAGQAAPRGDRVVRGTVDVVRDGSLTQITASDGAIIDFDGFDILAHETVRFLQPSEAARVLNRVLGPDATRIDGSLIANGQVYIVNPSGVFFGGSAVVDVGRLVAAAGHLSDDDFAAGIDRFTGLSGPVENLGTIQGHAVSLLGRTVANHGSVIAADGMIALVAGEDVFLGSVDGRVLIRVDGPAPGSDPDPWGVQNTGLLDAGRGEVNLTAGDVYSLAANHSGIARGSHVRIAGGAGGRVEVAGDIDASNASGVGGSIDVLGEEVVVGDASIDASGAAGGGEIRIGGDYQGKGEVPTARRTAVSSDAEIRADATEAGDGGRVIVWADEVTVFHGEISARGGEQSGDGGFAEVSGKERLVYRGLADLRAPAGATGTLLLDPENLTILSGDGAPSGGSLDDLLEPQDGV
ncbi:MAG: filamentous hemagglutinin N-terminal domain-containing protein, partial [Myxococcales bacterium]|nr:filamentous hemagglutinin N-terminal domain-containing protein [Myxococcales bacterium]